MKKFVLLLLLFSSACAYSQDLVAGEISYTHISGYTYQIFVGVYAQASTAIKRKYFLIHDGNGRVDSLPVTPPADSTGYLLYFVSDTVTYPGPGIYTIYMEADYLVDSVVNLPNAAHQPLYLEAELIISPTSGYIDGPAINQPLTNSAQQGLTYIYNFAAYDSDGDSLSYSLGVLDSGYSYTDISVDSVTGEITFNQPQSGQYLMNIKVSEWRLISGVRVLVGHVDDVLYFVFGIANGVEEIINDEILNLYPNPATNQFTLRTSSFHANEVVTVSIMNVLGQQTPLPTLLQFGGENTIIDINNLPAGIYFLQMKSGNAIVTKRFVKE